MACAFEPEYRPLREHVFVKFDALTGTYVARYASYLERFATLDGVRMFIAAAGVAPDPVIHAAAAVVRYLTRAPTTWSGGWTRVDPDIPAGFPKPLPQRALCDLLPISDR
jgi:hypothetical protein